MLNGKKSDGGFKKRVLKDETDWNETRNLLKWKVSTWFGYIWIYRNESD